jgi:hypothetical protein
MSVPILVFREKSTRQDALGTTIPISVDLQHPLFYPPGWLSIRRPVRVKTVCFYFHGFFAVGPSRLCRHPSIRSL